MIEIDEIKRLNDEFFKLYSDVYENRNFLGQQQVDYMQSKLYDTYVEQFSLLHLRHLVAHKEERFKLQENCAVRFPRTRRFLWWHKENESARLIAQEVQQDAEKYFAEYAERLNACENAAEPEHEPAQEPTPDVATVTPNEPQKSKEKLKKAKKKPEEPQPTAEDFKQEILNLTNANEQKESKEKPQKARKTKKGEKSNDNT